MTRTHSVDRTGVHGQGRVGEARRHGRAGPGAIALIACLSSLGLVACDKLSAGDDPAKACVAPRTMDAVKSLILSDLTTLYPDREKAFVAGTKMSIETPTLDSFDKTTKKITCTGKIKFDWYLPRALNTDEQSALLQGLVQIGRPVATGLSQYTIQPSAGGDSLIYGVDEPTANLKYVATTYINFEGQLAAAATAPPAPVQPGPADAAAPSSTDADPGSVAPQAAAAPAQPN
jgi:hypothetical protein